MPCDRNLIQLQKRGAWHYWNFSSYVPICGAGGSYAQVRACYVRARLADCSAAKRITKLCPDCVRIAKEGEGR